LFTVDGRGRLNIPMSSPPIRHGKMPNVVRQLPNQNGHLIV